MNSNLYLIGNAYKLNNINFKNNGNIDYLPLNNLITNYIQLYYENITLLQDNLSIIENENTSNYINQLIIEIGNLNQSYKVYNNNLIYNLTIYIIIIWFIIFLILLRYLYLKSNIFYLYILISIIGIIFMLYSFWTLFNLI